MDFGIIVNFVFGIIVNFDFGIIVNIVTYKLSIGMYVNYYQVPEKKPGEWNYTSCLEEFIHEDKFGNFSTKNSPKEKEQNDIMVDNREVVKKRSKLKEWNTIKKVCWISVLIYPTKF